MNNMDVVGEILITQEQINERAREIGAEIAKNHAEDNIILVRFRAGPFFKIGLAGDDVPVQVHG